MYQLKFRSRVALLTPPGLANTVTLHNRQYGCKTIWICLVQPTWLNEMNLYVYGQPEGTVHLTSIQLMQTMGLSLLQCIVPRFGMHKCHCNANAGTLEALYILALFTLACLP